MSNQQYCRTPAFPKWPQICKLDVASISLGNMGLIEKVGTSNSQNQCCCGIRNRWLKAPFMFTTFWIDFVFWKKNLILMIWNVWNVWISKWDYWLWIIVPSSLTQLSCTCQRTHAAGIATNLREFLPIFDTHFANDFRLPGKVERVLGFLDPLLKHNWLSE